LHCQSTITTRRSSLSGWAGYGYGYESAHSRLYWGVKLMLMTTADGTVTGFGLANPRLFGEREQTRRMLTDQPANRPAAGTAVVTDNGLAGQDSDDFFTDLDLVLIRPARLDEKATQAVPQLAASAHRSDHLHPQTSTRRGRPWRPGPPRRR
jgi:hypothetical protein